MWKEDDTQDMCQFLKMDPGLPLMEEINCSEFPMKVREALIKVSGML